jgi:hypothetical protein
VILDAVPAEDAQSFTQRRNQTIRSFFRSVRRAQSMLSAICRRSCGLGVEPEDFVEHPLIVLRFNNYVVDQHNPGPPDHVFTRRSRACPTRLRYPEC